MITVELYGTRTVLDVIEPGLASINAWLKANGMMCYRFAGATMIVIK